MASFPWAELFEKCTSALDIHEPRSGGTTLMMVGGRETRLLDDRIRVVVDGGRLVIWRDDWWVGGWVGR